ncbi:MAG: RHS repeat-associated core domain-containing protein, partial [Myxococcota bacterium]|nr:RHS repeat-associated core domain-containing protein [Myxococcota bacterium]
MAWDSDFLVEHTRVDGEVDLTVTMAYGDRFRLAEMTVLGRSYGSTFDAAGRHESIDDVVFTYDANTGYLDTVSDGVTTWQGEFGGYGTEAGRVMTIEGVGEVYRYTLTRDANLQVTGIQEELPDGSTRVRDLGLDPMGHVIEVVTDGELTEQHTWDLVENRVTSHQPSMGWSDATWTTDTSDRLLEGPEAAYTYDPQGARATRTGDDGTTLYAHSPDRELLTVTFPDGTQVRYRYDFAGRRADRALDGVVTDRYIWDRTGQLLAVADADGSVREHYLWVGGRPIRVEKDGVRYWLATDQIGSIRYVFDEAGAVVQAYEYDTWGQRTFVADSNFELSLGFAGGLHDGATGFVRFGLRDYDPATGVFVQPDPIWYAGGPNLYAYVGGAPHTYVDRDGLSGAAIDGSVTVAGAQIGGSAGIHKSPNGKSVLSLKFFGGGGFGGGFAFGKNRFKAGSGAFKADGGVSFSPGGPPLGKNDGFNLGDFIKFDVTSVKEASIAAGPFKGVISERVSLSGKSSKESNLIFTDGNG